MAMTSHRLLIGFVTTLATSSCGDTKPREIDRSCAVDADCEAKNFATCCGPRPSCVNATFEPETPELHCGPYALPCAAVPPFECRCVENTCEDVVIGQQK
jgi:hypothetical protein